jgi:fructose-bisphosphate aldolase class II
MAEGSAIAGLVVLGWEDALAYTEAAEELGCPVILQAGPGCRSHTPVPVIGKMLRYLAEQASVPIVIQIDHALTMEECHQAVDSGFTSLMIDGSMLPLDDNIALTQQVCALAKRYSVTVEGEVGAVGYASGAASVMTDVSEVQRYETETTVDALAISIGNVHLQAAPQAVIDYKRLAEIETVTKAPLVLHGGSGIAISDRIQLARETRICKFNIGTELRMAFGHSLRSYLTQTPQEFDRIKILSSTIPAIKAATKAVLGPIFRPHEPSLTG